MAARIMARQGCGRSSIPLLRGQCARSRRLQCGDLLQALALRIMSALRTLRVGAPTRRHAGLVYPPSRILRGVALHCRRMPVVLLNSRIVGDHCGILLAVRAQPRRGEVRHRIEGK
jgi:hypothetical protein